MPKPAKDIFEYCDSVRERFKRFSLGREEWAADIKAEVERLREKDTWSPQALVQISPKYKSDRKITEMVKDKALHPDFERIDRLPAILHCHQCEAIDVANRGDNYVITAGTGSGKSLGYIVPIINHILSCNERGEGRGIKAVICYPMNALVNSQMQELDKYELDKHSITYGRYTGQEGTKRRESIHRDPPDILLTNFMMLEYLLTRNNEGEKGILNALGACRFLVMDELHTYRGRQGADIAMLIRRLRLFLNKSASEEFLCVGTSATMTSGGDTNQSGDNSDALVAEYATSLFGREVKRQGIIKETLVRTTNQEKDIEDVKPHLHSEMQQGVDRLLESEEIFQNSAIAVWCEYHFGIDFSKVRPVRQHPQSIADMAEQLSLHCGKKKDAQECEEFLREFLTAAAAKRFFAVRLHQFFSGPGEFLCTVKDEVGSRNFSVKGEKNDHASNPFFATHFCRNCWHEFHPVEMQGEKFVYRSIDDLGLEDGEEISFGYITPVVEGMAWPGEDDETGDSKLPDAWLEEDRHGNIRVRRPRRNLVPRQIAVNPQGEMSKDSSGTNYVFLPGKFRFCPKCGDVHDGRGRDGNRLAALNAEGRCSATTALLVSLLEYEPPYKGDSKAKTLAFSDNRQDAALQAGYFNDFMFTLKMRAGLLKALEDAEGKNLRYNVIADKVMTALDFTMDAVRRNISRRREFLENPDNTNETNLQRMVNVLKDIVGYNLMHDLRVGWRHNNPNLAALNLLKINFDGIEQLAELAKWQTPPQFVRQMSGKQRVQLVREVMEHLLEERCIHSRYLSQESINRIKNTASGNLTAEWCDPYDDDHFKASRKMRLGSAGRGRQREYAASGPTSGIAKKIRPNSIWKKEQPGMLPTQEYKSVIVCVLETLRAMNLLIRSEESKDSSAWEVNSDCLIWQLTAAVASEADYHVMLYRSVQEMLSSDEARADFVAMEAREHTAQVNAADREEYERRFRNNPEENREERLPILVCSPTMELGIDISDLNTVYLRNVPPTPANYVQRSGRAGRAESPALIVSYCAARSPHDQYYFQRKQDMVAGRIRAPKIELANQDLLTSHFNAIWLQKTGVAFPNPVSQIMEYAADSINLPVREEYKSRLQNLKVEQEVQKDIAGLVEDLGRYNLIPKHAQHWLVSDYTPPEGTHMYEGLEAALHRWRLLFRAVSEQMHRMLLISNNLNLSKGERERATRLYEAARRQRETLIEESEQDFYSYRFLASQGFLPGYNFPRLPLMAFLPRRRKEKHPDRVMRPRFLALSEFGPGSFIYHQGSRYRIARAILQQKQKGADGVELAIDEMYICENCGYGYPARDIPDCCLGCEQPLAMPRKLNSMYEAGNFVAQPVDRINAGEEERQRQGYDLMTSYAFGESQDDKISGKVNAGGHQFSLDYGHAAMVWRINLGWKRRQKGTVGFWIDQVTGDWKKQGEEKDGDSGECSECVVPYVKDRRNILIMRWDKRLSPNTVTTLRHALKLGMTEVFQIEESELSVEPLPRGEERNNEKSSNCRAFLYYESAEGGAGVLTRLPAEKHLLAQVAKTALQMMHYELPDDVAGIGVDELVDKHQKQDACKSGCYRCLLSYYNQPDHQHIDREDSGALAILLDLANAGVVMSSKKAKNTSPSSLSAWESAATDAGWKMPDAKGYSLSGKAKADYYYTAAQAAVFIGEAPSGAIQDALENKGILCIHFPAEQGEWTRVFQHPEHKALLS